MFENKEPPHVQLATMSRWYVVSRAIHTVAKLELANYMSIKEPKSVDILAKATKTKVQHLDRLLKFLSNYGIFEAHEGPSYALTALSQPLRDDDPHSIRDVICMVDENWWQAFSQLDRCVASGRSAFFEQHGDDFFSFLAKSPQRQKNFDKGMAKLSNYDDEAISRAFDFHQFKTLVDLGGGRGGLVKCLAKLYPKLQISLFDTASVIDQLQLKSFPKQVHLIKGDFFSSIPKAEAYIFKGVLHDFNDENMHKILKNCAKQMPANANLFIAEQVLPEHDKPHPNKTMDIVMMALLGGRQRTSQEWQKCIEPSGFVFEESYNTESIFTLMRFKPK